MCDLTVCMHLSVRECILHLRSWLLAYRLHRRERPGGHCKSNIKQIQDIIKVKNEATFT